MNGFLLGLSNSVACLAYCAPAFVPLLMGEGKGVMRSYGLLAQFLTGRLSGYLLFALLAWGVHHSALQVFSRPEPVIGVFFVAFSVMLLLYGFRTESSGCARPRLAAVQRMLEGTFPGLLPIAAGFVTGLSFCPPFLLAFTGATAEPSLLSGMAFFFTFFLGTSIFLLPAPLWGMFRDRAVLKTIGKMAAGLMGVYYFYQGAVMLIGGIV